MKGKKSRIGSLQDLVGSLLLPEELLEPRLGDLPAFAVPIKWNNQAPSIRAEAESRADEMIGRRLLQGIRARAEVMAYEQLVVRLRKQLSNEQNSHDKEIRELRTKSRELESQFTKAEQGRGEAWQVFHLLVDEITQYQKAGGTIDEKNLALAALRCETRNQYKGPLFDPPSPKPAAVQTAPVQSTPAGRRRKKSK